MLLIKTNRYRSYISLNGPRGIPEGRSVIGSKRINPGGFEGDLE